MRSFIFVPSKAINYEQLHYCTTKFTRELTKMALNYNYYNIDADADDDDEQQAFDKKI